jgi:hypothetical protein
MHDAIPDVCSCGHVCVLWKAKQKNKKNKKNFFWRMVLCAVSFAGYLCVCLGLTQLIQCREYRFAVKVSTCNNLPSKYEGGFGKQSAG